MHLIPQSTSCIWTNLITLVDRLTEPYLCEVLHVIEP